MTIKKGVIRIPHTRPTFLEGMARVMDIGGTLNQYDTDDLLGILDELRARRLAASSGPKAEADAMRDAWIAVGQCIYDAIGHFEVPEHGKPPPLGRSE